MTHLAIVRHGQSEWNRENRFTGWTDVPLTDRGREEAVRAGQCLARTGLQFDVCFTSVLSRGEETARIVLDTLGTPELPMKRTWWLNERHFGALQGMGRFEAVRAYGLRRVLKIQSSYDLRPPPLDPADPRAPARDPLYDGVDEKELPLTESLQDTYARVIPYWQEVIAPELRRERSLLVVAHKNSLRALVKHLEHIPDAETPRLHLPTGQPLLYEMDENLRVRRRAFLGSKPPRRRRLPGLSPA